MPTAALKPCTHQPCDALVIGGACPQHRTSASRFRGSSTSRGYDARWEKLRNHFIKLPCEQCGDRPSATCQQCAGSGLANAFCAECLASGRFQQTKEVDHIIPWLAKPALKMDRRNLQGLCSRHHSIKTRAEDYGLALSAFQQQQNALVMRRLSE